MVLALALVLVLVRRKPGKPAAKPRALNPSAANTKTTELNAAETPPELPVSTETSADSATATELALEADFSSAPLSLFEGLHGGSPGGVIVAGGWQLVGPGACGRSITGLPAKPGEVFQCQYDVRLLRQPTNGTPMNFFVGLQGLNEKREVVFYWVEESPFNDGETSRVGVSEAKMPDGVATVHLAAHGSWAAEGHVASDGAIEVLRLRMHQKPA